MSTLLKDFIMGRPKKGQPVKASTLAPIRSFTPSAFNAWVKEFNVSTYFNHEISQQTCQNLKILKYQKVGLDRRLQQVSMFRL